jgi:hypothetical protein
MIEKTLPIEYQINMIHSEDFLLLEVFRTDLKQILSWDILQAIKNKVLGDFVMAVECYPSEKNLINSQNSRHLWIWYGKPFGLHELENYKKKFLTDTIKITL